MVPQKPLAAALVWLRRDLRLEDHSALAHAEAEGLSTALAFVFDPNILKKLPPEDRRLSFISESLSELNEQIQAKGSTLITRLGDPVHEIPKLAKALGVKTVLANRDYEPYAKERDEAVARALEKLGIGLQLFKDQVIFEGTELLSGSGTPYRVFTPYKNAWLAKLGAGDFEERGIKGPRLCRQKALAPLVQACDLKTLGFTPQKLWLNPGAKAAQAQLRAFRKRMPEYKNQRDLPSVDGTSALSVHLRFGTISIRACVREALAQKNQGASTWLSELIWRDFFQMVLDQFPQVGRGEAFRAEYDSMKWPGTAKHFEAWCRGETGYPLVDAAMRHFAETGWMHNRLRMVVASFLTKDLLVDWKKGEAFFAQHLLDFDLAANNGGWQWCASTGCDAQPYFRIFHPHSQSRRFDPEGKFIRKFVPELRHLSAKEIHEPPPTKGYPAPLVDHAKQRLLALALFKKAAGKD